MKNRVIFYSTLFAILLLSNYCKARKDDEFSLYGSIGIKTDLRLSDRINPIEHSYNSPLSPPGSLTVSETSGMKYCNVYYPYLGLKLKYIPIENQPYEFHLNAVYNKRGQVWKESIIDTLNVLKEVDYVYTFLDLGLGLYLNDNGFICGVSINDEFNLKSDVTYYSKSSQSLERNEPTSHWYLTPGFIWGFSLGYHFANNKYDPGFTFFVQPYFHNSKSATLGFVFSFKIASSLNSHA